MVAVTKKPLINPNLITLKCVLFTFFGGLGCIFPFQPAHMRALGLDNDHSRLIQIVAPAISILGPLLVCLLADRWIAVKKGARYGSYIRILTVILILFACLFYALLLLVPKVNRTEQRRSLVTFACDPEGAYILQEKCLEEKICHNWRDKQYGNLVLSNCSYTCLDPENFENRYQPFIANDELAKSHSVPQQLNQPELSSEIDYLDDEPERPQLDVKNVFDRLRSDNDRKKRQISSRTEVPVPPPHVCMTRKGKPDLCHAYIIGNKIMKVPATINSVVLPEEGANDTISLNWCRYPIDDYSCSIPEPQMQVLMKDTPDCKPTVECDIDDPYASGSSLAEARCIKVDGNVELTEWSYFGLRIIVDGFPLAALVLLDTSIIIATRETSTGRGDVGHQLAWGALGLAVFGPIAGAVAPLTETPYLISISLGVVLLFISALILLFSRGMPLTPPEWWWHTKIGMLAIPMSAIRKYAPEVVALGFVSIILGALWASVDQYQWWHVFHIAEDWITSDLAMGISILVCALPAFPLLWYAEIIVDYCGHNYILIGAFCFYVMRYTGLAIVHCPWALQICEFLECITLIFTFVTFVLYMRHLVPRRLIATGQAVPVIGHFCLGRLIGGLIGLAQDDTNFLESVRMTYSILAVVAALCAVLYFLLYQFWLLPKCIPPTQPPPSETLHGQSNGTNGSYTPLRVYHDGKAKKGHFRY